jgi:hypothetical protein
MAERNMELRRGEYQAQNRQNGKTLSVGMQWLGYVLETEKLSLDLQEEQESFSIPKRRDWLCGLTNLVLNGQDGVFTAERSDREVKLTIPLLMSRLGTHGDVSSPSPFHIISHCAKGQ